MLNYQGSPKFFALHLENFRFWVWSSLVISALLSSSKNHFPGLRNVFVALGFLTTILSSIFSYLKSESCRNADKFEKLYPLITFRCLRWSLTPSHLCRICYESSSCPVGRSVFIILIISISFFREFSNRCDGNTSLKNRALGRFKVGQLLPPLGWLFSFVTLPHCNRQILPGWGRC